MVFSEFVCSPVLRYVLLIWVLFVIFAPLRLEYLFD